MGDLIETLEDGVLTLTINRPEAANTINASLAQKMMEALHRSEKDPDVRCIAITGAGKFFCAGGDVNDQASGGIFDEEASDPEAKHKAAVKMIRDGMELNRLLHVIAKPTLAIMPGAAAGAGLALALSCDLRFCLDTAKLTTAFAKLGLSGDSGGTYFLSQLVGAAKARELYFTADVITGREAYEMGLVTKVASAETFVEDSKTYAKYIAGLPTVALGYIKQNINAAFDLPLEDVFDLEAENVVRSMETEDHKNAAAAFVNKEQVIFKGR